MNYTVHAARTAKYRKGRIMLDEQTVNEAGGCKHCGYQTFSVLEELEYPCNLQSGLLVQVDGPIEHSEIVSAKCTRCGIVYEVEELGEFRLKQAGV